ncbi:hypothetical protein FHR99_000399 [Litorivivens lipolytica]|uniref:Glycerol kinase n=1 Tax=Litorivivens lipolytica TaxID=1524264 RepID=A0A7W4W2B9_9GAMM|nr:hypothetical protein [Litorivivens lipolytica]MBB3046163.1 hypothetical protein [Litorivivens lipolytica]
MSDDKISTTALAKLLEVPVQQLFATLKDYDWIRKVADGWALTPKGEFEGGEYHNSKRYGRYIVWPVSLEQHAMLRALEDNKMLGAAAIGQPYGLSGRAVNRILAELGWQKRESHGWMLNSRGQQQGGVQLENRQSDMLYVLWPEAVADNAVLIQRLREVSSSNGEAPSGDLFAGSELFTSIDGHQHDSRERQQICQWLYLAGVLHATARQLPVEEPLKADFFLPLNQVFIDFWAADATPTQLKAQMRRAELYKKHAWHAIELHPEDIDQLDDVMPRQLLKFGVKFS